ncbi:Fumarylacetoacetate hydrolase family protein [Candidatus Sulfotelmatomonas gaucii]|uniref:Fumarylacetoacetate hydrolase family protein n=1 Tax=Candidatus Sulfuritelmatomonas gaucii TaxID=2043161 RepID=A0A2N9L474_9BACT|nr:Fumarylacetoacetate hydrolase family protein [Candidatus Sulfotelmatomonas gaucii]
MKLVSFSLANNSPRPGALIEDAGLVVDLVAAGYSESLAAISAGISSIDKPGAYPAYKLSDIRLHAPLANPPRIFAIGLNYRDHAAESKMALPSVPVVFFKMPTAIIGPGDAIVLPKNSSEPDYEAELAFVVGKGGFRIPASEWRDHVYGYTIINDVSARDVQRATSQWSLAKSFPTFCPMGPAIVPASQIDDPHQLDISLSINGELLQSSNTRELIFKVPDLVEYISSITPLLPGDIVSTGTPAGVGMGRKPQRWLRPGDTVTVSLKGLGSLVNPVVAE